MGIRTKCLIISGALMVSTTAVPTSAQMNDETVRGKVRTAVRLQLHLKADDFLGVRRDEKLEQLLATVSVKEGGPAVIYQLSQAGDEFKKDIVVHHLFMDVDPRYIVAVGQADGGIYRIHGFADSLAEFGRLMSVAQVKVRGLEQAEAVSDFYREVNPQTISITPIESLIEMKQAAERQCLTSSSGIREQKFDAWWKHGRPFYERIPFRQTVSRRGDGYLVEWVVLSLGVPGNCGGAPLRARLEVNSDGQVGKPTFSPLGKP